VFRQPSIEILVAVRTTISGLGVVPNVLLLCSGCSIYLLGGPIMLVKECGYGQFARSDSQTDFDLTVRLLEGIDGSHGRSVNA
jgi:hypothetical protein